MAASLISNPAGGSLQPVRADQTDQAASHGAQRVERPRGADGEKAFAKAMCGHLW